MAIYSGLAWDICFCRIVSSAPFVNGKADDALHLAGVGSSALAIYLRKLFLLDITTSDYDDKEIEENMC
ncbi:hypothetical protein CFP56_029004 [Quercus suber]|uniref:Uncharacterized protein n=1 Tax=Quercus suber TaxID=58331 RepID=A0AAW0JSB4_QUESU